MIASPLSNLLRVLVASAASIPFVAAQTTDTEITAITDELYAKISPNAAPPGFNVQGGSVFQNFARAFKDKQFFYLMTMDGFTEKPGKEPFSHSTINWCSDLTFSDFSNSSSMGYAGRCVATWLTGYADAIAAGIQSTYVLVKGEFSFTTGISAVFVEQLNVFEGQHHSNTDDNVFRFWDDGRKTMPAIAWEGHDEGDMHPNAATSSFSYFGDFTWMSVAEVAQLFNTSTDEFTPEKFKQVYLDTWIKSHEVQAKIQTDTAEAALAIIDLVKNEANSAAEIVETPPAQTDTEEDGGSGTNTATPIEDDGSAGNGRKLTSVAARFVSAALRVFGI